MKKILGFIFSATGLLIAGALLLFFWFKNKSAGPRLPSGQTLLSSQVQQPPPGQPQAAPPIVAPAPTPAPVTQNTDLHNIAGIIQGLAGIAAAGASAYGSYQANSGGGGGDSAGFSSWS